LAVTARRKERRRTRRALVACRRAWADWISAQTARVLTPGFDFATATEPPPDVAAKLIALDPFLGALLADEEDVRGIRPYLPAVARALGVEGDLTEAQIMYAARQFAGELCDELRVAALAGCAA
jgi:hypothetical protein